MGGLFILLSRTDKGKQTTQTIVDNLRISSIKWQGKATTNTDGAFEQFATMEYGVRAMIILLKGYINKHKLDTLPKIIKRYAPAADNNNEGSYVAQVTKHSGITATQKLVADKHTLRLLVRSMARHENGVDCVTDETFDKAFNLI